MKRIFYYTIIFLQIALFSSCSGESTEDPVYLREDTLSTTLELHSDTAKPEEVMIHPDSSFRSKAVLLGKKWLRNAAKNENFPSLFPSRFESEWNYSFSIKRKDSIETISSYYFYEYKDSSSLANVLSNWYSCFGDKCERISEGENKKIRGNASFTLIGDNTLIHAAYTCNNKEAPEEKEEIKQLFGERKSREIEVSCKGNLQWRK